MPIPGTLVRVEIGDQSGFDFCFAAMSTVIWIKELCGIGDPSPQDCRLQKRFAPGGFHNTEEYRFMAGQVKYR